MNLKKLLGVILICTIMLLPATACDGGVDYKPLDLVPQGADMLAGIKVSDAVRAWQLFAELDGSEETSGFYDEIREEMLNTSGLDLSTISEFFIFADMSETESIDNETQWKRIYILGGVAATLSLIAVVFDIVVGSSMGGNLSALPQTAVDRFAQFQQNPWLGLYNLDLLNTVNQLISIPVYFALYAVHRKTNKP